jgi:hypothetical protein
MRHSPLPNTKAELARSLIVDFLEAEGSQRERSLRARFEVSSRLYGSDIPDFRTTMTELLEEGIVQKDRGCGDKNPLYYRPRISEEEIELGLGEFD